MRIVLADPPWVRHSQLNNYPNIGILYLGAALRQDGHEVIYLPGLRQMAWHLDRLKELRPDLYGISFATPLKTWSYYVLNAVREQFPKMPIMCGGPHPTGEPVEVLRQTGTDVCAIGEGEETVRGIASAIENHGDLKEVAGIVFRSGEELVSTSRRPLVLDIDDLPMPAWDLADDYIHEYSGNTRALAKPSTCMVVARGCPWNCVFCSQPVWKNQKPYIRAHSPERVADELELLRKKGIREVYIRADELNFTKKWAVQTARAIEARKLTDLRLQCNLIAKMQNVDEELAEALASANFKVVHIGVESANQRVIDGVQKPVTVESIEQCFRFMRKAGIKVFAFLMMYQVWEEKGTLQYETTEEVENTLRWAKKMAKQDLIQFMSWSFATPFTGASLDNIATKYGIRKPVPQKLESEGIWEAKMSLPGITEREMNRMRRKGMILQGYLAWKSGALLQPRNYSRIFSKIRYLLKASS